MKNFNDKRIYFIFACVTLVCAMILAMVSGYSRLFVEPEIEKLLSAGENIEQNYARAYVKLREPQIFGGYDRYDREGARVMNSLKYFDEKMISGKAFVKDDLKYLKLLENRRIKGSQLGLKTVIYCMVLSCIGWIMVLIERKQTRS
jgi:hypothetical protein